MAESGRRRCNIHQKMLLVNYMLANKDFALGTFTGPMGVVQQNEKWAKLAQELANLGPNKSVDQWITTWRDLRSKAKAAYAKRARALQETGNPDRPVPELGEMNEKILSLIGRTTSEGMEVPESSISGAQPAIPSPPPPQDVLMDVLSDTEEGGVPFPPPPPTPTPQLRRGPPKRLPRRRLVQAVRQPAISKIYEQSQKENLSVLKDISNHLKRRNEIEDERNNIMKKRNQLFELQIYQQTGFKVSEEVEHEDDEDDV